MYIHTKKVELPLPKESPTNITRHVTLTYQVTLLTSPIRSIPYKI